MQISIDMPGLRELDAQLEALGKVVATTVATKAIKASAEVLQRGWQRGAPFDPRPKPKTWTLASGEKRSRDYGHLNQNIRVRPVVPEKQNAVVFKVTTGDAFWGYFQEFGTARHRAHPWARPILENVKSECLRVQIDVLRQGIEAEAGKIARKRYGPVMANGRNG